MDWQEFSLSSRSLAHQCRTKIADYAGGVHRSEPPLSSGGPGKTSSDDDFHQLVGDLEERVFDKLPDDTWFYPGHGDDSTIGAERPKLPEWKGRGW